MRERTVAREFATQVLYQADLNGDWRLELIEQAISVRANTSDDEDRALLSPLSPKAERYARELFSLFLGHRSTVDLLLHRAAPHWSVARMAITDRNILRLAVVEMLYVEGISLSVSINEAIELAKKFSGDDSGGFINGVLDKIAADIEQGLVADAVDPAKRRRRAVNE